MAAPAGNQFWKVRSSHGRNPIFKSPEELWASCVEYFDWVEENPLLEDKAFAYEGDVTHESMAKMRAMTLGGLCIFLDISRRSWGEYRQRKDFLPICEQVEEIIRDQKFGGAAAGLLNANIIARDLGLAERQEHTGKDGGPIQTEELNDMETARRVAFILAKGLKD